MTPETIAVGLSGGVDSATAAALLVEAGHRVIGLSMRLYDAAGTPAAVGRCCGPRDLEDARGVAAHLRIPFFVIDDAERFRAHVIDDFVSEYLAGRTPNPCVRCNEHVKLGPLLRHARALGAEALATGHYARIERDDGGRPTLHRGTSAAKDQAYFLFALPPSALPHLRFPLGALPKDEVRARARALGLPNAAKAESQEICFVPDGDHAAFVAREAVRRGAPVRPGVVVDEGGRVLGEHDGVHRFTIGQRRGVGISEAAGRRYVTAIDAAGAQVTLSEAQALLRDRILVDDVRWLCDATPARVSVQLRHRHAAVAASLTPVSERCVEVAFDAPERAVAAGQAAVFFEGDRVMGGGWVGR